MGGGSGSELEGVSDWGKDHGVLRGVHTGTYDGVACDMSWDGKERRRDSVAQVGFVGL